MKENGYPVSENDAPSEAWPETIEQEGPHLRDYLHVLRKHLWLILLVLVVVVTVTAVATFRMQPVYRAKAVIQFETPTADFEQLLIPSPPDRSFFQNGLQHLQLRSFLQPIWSELGEEVMSFDEFASALEAEGRRDTTFADISMEGTDPEYATRAVNLIVQQFSVMMQMRLESNISNLTTQMLASAREARRNMGLARQEMLDFLKTNNISNIEMESARKDQKRIQLDADLREVRRRREQLDLDVQLADQAAASPDAVEALLRVPFLGESPEGASFRKRREELQFELQGQRNAGRGTKYPEVRQLEQTLDQMDVPFLRTVEMKLMLRRQERDRLLIREAELEAGVGALDRELAELADKTREYAELESAYEVARAFHEEEMNSSGTLERKGASTGAPVHVVELAEVPTAPVKPRKAMNLTLAVLIGLFAGALLAFFLEYLDDSIKNPDDVDRWVHLPLLGVVTDIAETKEGAGQSDLVAHVDPKSTVAESYRAVRTSLTYASADKPLRIFLVTSAGPGEGKTLNAVNLAIAFAQSGQRTLLIDADMRRPRIHRIFDVENPHGLSSTLARGMPLEEVATESHVPNLFVLPTGPIPPNPSEMLASTRMQEVLDEAAARFDRVIIDSPPTAAVTDACVLGPRADGVIQIVLAGATSRKLVNRGKNQLLSVGSRHLGVLLNGVKTRGHGYDYYYAGYYYYRYYGEKREKQRRKKTGAEPSRTGH